MRRLLIVGLCIVAAACGKVNSYTDAAPGDDTGGDGGGTIDAKPAIDGPPFVCDQQACGADDACCPSACNANNDPNCSATCDNGVIEGSETCDPLATCPGACPTVGCQLRQLDNPGTCNAACSNAGLISQCATGDSCCPAGCNAANDGECAAVCGNGVQESGELCDGNCPASCPQIGCQLYTLVDNGPCQQQCVDAGQQGACVSGDGCCPAGCNANNDGDCAPVCGNQVTEQGETCDGPNCPQSCAPPAQTCWTESGSAATCNLQCNIPVQTCGLSDRCCPFIANSGGSECTRNDDGECGGTSWRALQISWAPLSWTPGQVLAVRVYGIRPGDSVLFTTCTPDGSQNTDDTYFNSITDLQGVQLAGPADDSYDPNFLTRLAGWHCDITGGSLYLTTDPMNDGGFIVPGDPASSVGLVVNYRGFNASTAGSAKLFIWWNGSSTPNPG